MAYILRAVGNATNVAVNVYEVDNDDDVDTLDVSAAPMGSTCYVINTNHIYKLDSTKTWHQVQ